MNIIDEQKNLIEELSLLNKPIGLLSFMEIIRLHDIYKNRAKYMARIDEISGSKEFKEATERAMRRYY